MADRRLLGPALRRMRVSSPEGAPSALYRVPTGTYLLLTKIVAGVSGQPGFRYYSLRDTAFMYSWGRYWPASAVKLVAAVGALWTLGDYGVDGRALIELEDADGRFSGPYRLIQRRALRLSTNVEYNRLMEIAGFERLNERYLSARYGTPRMVLQRRYTHPAPEANLRNTPAVRFRLNSRSGTIPERRSARTYARCPKEANCTTLFELQEVLRRVMLHEKLPPDQRYPLKRRDLERLREDLLAAPNKLEPAATRALGHVPRIFNKAGRVPGDDHLDNTYIETVPDKRRLMLALSVPYSSANEPDRITKEQLEALAEASLRVAAKLSERGVWLQHDVGTVPKVRLESRSGGRYSLRIAVSSAGRLRYSLWLGHRRLSVKAAPAGSGHPASADFRLEPGRSYPLVVLTRRGRRSIGYHFFEIEVP